MADNRNRPSACLACGQVKKTEGGDQLSIPVRGVNRNAALRISPETGAVPGERIVGIRMPGEGIVIYPIFARALESSTASPTAGST